MTRFIPRILALAVVIGLVSLIARQHSVVDEDGNQPLMTIFVLYIVLAFVLGFIFISYILPWMGDRVGELVYAGEGEVADDPKAPVRALEAQGDYEGAIEMLRELQTKHPGDRTITVEIAKLYQENLRNTAAAVSTFEQALSAPESPWDKEDRAYFLFRLVDLNAEELGDFDRARELLNQVITEFPETRHSANATHKLHEVDQAEYAASRAQKPE